MKNYQYNLNTVAWLAIIAIILALVLSSCKKEKQLEPELPLPITQSTIHYKRILTFMWQYDEIADIYVYGSTMSGPCSASGGIDTVNYPHFYYTPKSTPLVINGNCTISSNNDTLYLTYSNHNPLVNTTNWVIKAKYLKQ